jgi:hypothetical protein
LKKLAKEQAKQKEAHSKYISKLGSSAVQQKEPTAGVDRCI